MAAVLVQLTYFGRFWAALARRAVAQLPRRAMTARGHGAADWRGSPSLRGSTTRRSPSSPRARRVRPTGRGDRIVSELESGADVFVLASGEAEVSSTAPASASVLGKLGPGGAFGEMSSLTGELRSATR